MSGRVQGERGEYITRDFQSKGSLFWPSFNLDRILICVKATEELGTFLHPSNLACISGYGEVVCANISVPELEFNLPSGHRGEQAESQELNNFGVTTKHFLYRPKKKSGFELNNQPSTARNHR